MTSWSKRQRPRRSWRRFSHRDFTATLEEHVDGWHIYVGKHDLGSFGSKMAAGAFVRRLADRQGCDDADDILQHAATDRERR